MAILYNLHVLLRLGYNVDSLFMSFLFLFKYQYKKFSQPCELSHST